MEKVFGESPIKTISDSYKASEKYLNDLHAEWQYKTRVRDLAHSILESMGKVFVWEVWVCNIMEHNSYPVKIFSNKSNAQKYVDNNPLEESHKVYDIIKTEVE